MEIILQEMLERLSTMHRSLEKAITGLPNEALDWLPGPEMNSLGVLMAHTLGATRFWIGDVAGGDPSGRVREAEFMTTGVSAAELIAHSHEALAHSQSILSHLSLADLDAICKVPGSEREVTGAWAVLHALDHMALHVGHMEITRQLWDAHQAGRRE